MTGPADSEVPRPAPQGAGRSVSAFVAVRRCLEESRSLGFLGPGPVDQHLTHAKTHARIALSKIPNPVATCDLGAGGGVPGLVLAAVSDSPITLLDAMHKRTRFLADAILALGFDHASVATARGEDFARAHESAFQLVVARSFGAPAVTAEIAVRMMTLDGVLCASAGPETLEGWRDGRLGELGLALETEIVEEGATFVVVRKVADTAEMYPRRVGVPSKRPLW